MEATSERGLALVLTMMAITLMLSLGSALILLSTAETAIAANFREGQEAAYAADAAIERAIADLRTVPDLTLALNGTVRSTFVDGAPGGSRTLSDGSVVNLDQVANWANCQKVTACTAADLTAVTSDRPWGVNNPRWLPYGYGALASLLGTPISSPFYVIALIGDDGSESDGDAGIDGGEVAGVANRGKDIVVIRGEAFGPRNAHSVAEATVARVQIGPASAGGQTSTALRVLAWRNVR